MHLFDQDCIGVTDHTHPSALLPVPDEPPARLFVDPPLAEPLSRGRVFIPYRTENLRILPVFGAAALEVSPRLGHVHVTVDDASWHFIDTSGEAIVLVGLPAGPHHVLVELADPTHQVIDRARIAFEVPVSSPTATI